MDEEDAIWDDRFAESEEAVIGVCWYCEAKLRDGYDRAPLCRYAWERRRADPQGDDCSF